MIGSYHRHGIFVTPHQKEVCLFWRTDDPSLPGILLSRSKDGKAFKKSIDFIAYTKKDKTLITLGKKAIIRSNDTGASGNIFISEPDKPGLFITIQKNHSWKVLAESSLLTGPTVTLKIPETKKVKLHYIAFSSRGSRAIFQAKSTSTLSRFRESGIVLRARPGRFDHSRLTPLYTELLKEQILLVYSAEDPTGSPTLGAALFARTDPTMLVWRSEFPLWQSDPKQPRSEVRFLGGFPQGKYFSLYIESRENGIEYFPVARYWEASRFESTHSIVLPKRVTGIKIGLQRVDANPIIEPRALYAWEAFASFNPAALFLDNKIHLLYRAQGYNGQSVLGYAGSANGIQIDERSTDPVFVPPHLDPSEDTLYPLASGGGTGGCEDPRLVEINGTVYLIYVAFDGTHPPGVALTYISTSNFLKKRWRWARPRLISRPGQIQKNWVLFPQKIGGKYAILHGLTPEIRIEYLDSLNDLGKKHYIESLSSHGGRGYVDTDRLFAWDNIVRGTGAPPLLTKAGWLVFYHGMDMRDPGKYKVGVFLLDRDHPEIILRRAIEPVLEPETHYENNGHKRGVVYVCGAVIKDKTLFVYYGASDRTTAVATANLDTFLNDLLKEKSPHLQKMNIRKRS